MGGKDGWAALVGLVGRWGEIVAGNERWMYIFLGAIKKKRSSYTNDLSAGDGLKFYVTFRRMMNVARCLR